jgi:hypothetical protein
VVRSAVADVIGSSSSPPGSIGEMDRLGAATGVVATAVDVAAPLDGPGPAAAAVERIAASAVAAAVARSAVSIGSTPLEIGTP